MRLIPGFDPWVHAEGCWIDHDEAQRAIDFFEKCLRHIEGKVSKKLFILEPWQRAVVANLFGWKRKNDKGRIVRRFRTLFLYVPRKNGKTPFVAGLCLFLLICDGEPGAQIYSAAAEREQAAILFRHAKGMVENEPLLDERVTIYGGGGSGGLRSIVLKEDEASVFKVLSADADTKHGQNPHVVMIDELHAQPNRDLVDTLETGFASDNREQPLLVYLTTADFDRPSICNEKYKQACQVRDNGGDANKPGFDQTFLPVIYEATDKDDWTDEAVWAKANPNLGVSVSLDYLRNKCRQAKETPVFENTFKRLHLNMRTQTDVKLISMDLWDACAEPFELSSLYGRDCYGGLDLASTEDLASFSLVFPGDVTHLFVWSWCPEDKVKRRARMQIPYDEWARLGHLTATGGNQIDYDTIHDHIVAQSELFNIKSIGFDPYQAESMQQGLSGAGLSMVKVPQTHANLSGPTKELLRLVKSNRLRHGGNPVVRWAASNVAAYIKGKIPTGQTIGDYLDKVPIMPSKQNSADKIDPITATVIAISQMMAAPAAPANAFHFRII